MANLKERISPRGRKKKRRGGGNKGKAVIKRKGTAAAHGGFSLSDAGAQDLILLPDIIQVTHLSFTTTMSI